MSKKLVTLRDIAEQHPEWMDLPVTVADEAGNLTWLDGSLLVFPSKADDDTDILTFDPC